MNTFFYLNHAENACIFGSGVYADSITINKMIINIRVNIVICEFFYSN